MPLPSRTTSRKTIFVSHLCEAGPTQPGTTSYNGWPFMGCIGASSIAKAIRVCGFTAFSMGIPRDKRDLVRLIERLIRSMVGGVNGRLSDLGAFQYIGESHPRPSCAADRAHRSLPVLGRRVEERPAVAAAFDDKLSRDDLKVLLQVGNGKG